MALISELHLIDPNKLQSKVQLLPPFFFFSVVSYENVCGIALFFIDPTLNATNCVITLTIFFVGIGIMCLVKLRSIFTQPNAIAVSP